MYKVKKINKSWLVTISLIFVVACLCVSFIFSGQSSEAASADSQIQEQTGLGLGINVITAEQINDFKTGSNIFDNTALQNLTSSKITLNESVSSTFSTTKINEILAKYSYTFGSGLSVESFIGSLSANFEMGASFNFADYQYKYYYILDHELNRYKLYINNYRDKSTYSECFSTSFLNDLNNLSSGALTYNSFFNKYGTHIVGSAIYGGRLNAYYTVVSNKIVLNQELKVAIDSAISATSLSTETEGSILSGINSNLGKQYTSADIATSFFVTASGGSALASNTISNFNSSYNNWCNSFDNLNNSVVIDYPKDGLVPLWEILPTQYSSLSNSMKSAFTSQVENGSREFLDKFKTGNYIDFNGGTGISLDPYLINTPSQMLNIEKVNMNACYKLVNDINLSGYSQWNAIGGHYRKNPFNGTFDGDNHTISNLKRTSDIQEQNNRIYFGMFGAIGPNGCVKNITFKNINIAMTGPAVYNNHTRVFVGGVAGATSGTISNITMQSGKVSYNCCTNGGSLTGSIVGVANDATIEKCTNHVSVTSGRYGSAAGGIAGCATGTNFLVCKNYGSVTSYCTGWGGSAAAGGIIGENDNINEGFIYNCYNYGALKADRYAFALMGYDHVTGEIVGKTNTVDYY